MVKLLNGSMKIGIQSEIQLKSWRLQFGKKKGQQQHTAYIYILGNKGELSIFYTKHKHAWTNWKYILVKH